MLLECEHREHNCSLPSLIHSYVAKIPHTDCRNTGKQIWFPPSQSIQGSDLLRAGVHLIRRRVRAAAGDREGVRVAGAVVLRTWS